MNWRLLYVGDSVAGRENRIKQKICRSAWVRRVYVIALAANEQNLLDLIPAWNLRQRAYPKKELTVVGLAGDRSEALELVRRIVDETYQNTGGVDVRAYLAKREGV